MNQEDKCCKCIECCKCTASHSIILDPRYAKVNPDFKDAFDYIVQCQNCQADIKIFVNDTQLKYVYVFSSQLSL